MLLGKCTRSAFLQSPFTDWFKPNYDSYVVDSFTCNFISPLLAGKGLPPEALTAATDSIGGTNEVADRLAAAGNVPPAAIDQLRQVANESFMPALHTAAFVSAGLLLVAILVILFRLPAKAEAVVWTGTGPGSAPNAGPAITDAESQVHLVDETGDDLSEGADPQLQTAGTQVEPATYGRHAAKPEENDSTTDKTTEKSTAGAVPQP